jgi:hypothetical protein
MGRAQKAFRFQMSELDNAWPLTADVMLILVAG